MTLQQMEYVLAVDRFRHFCQSGGTLPGDTAYSECHDTETGGGVGNENIRPGTTTGLSDACRSLGHIPGS